MENPVEAESSHPRGEGEGLSGRFLRAANEFENLRENDPSSSHKL